jgi:predicted nuclease with TOPRIM domain
VTDYEVIAREVSGYQARFEAIEERLAEVEKVNARLEAAALTTARAMQEIARHWDAVYEAMRREEEPKDLQKDLSEALGSERYDFHPRESE